MKSSESIKAEILSSADFREVANMSRSTEWRLRQKGVLPPRVVVNGIVLGYSSSSVMSWIENHEEQL